jgi:hypothetical protein
MHRIDAWLVSANRWLASCTCGWSRSIAAHTQLGALVTATVFHEADTNRPFTDNLGLSPNGTEPEARQ